MTINFAAQTNIGQKRQINEDSLWPRTAQHSHTAADPRGMLFIVADGMGGHGAGDIASGLAVSEISETYYNAGEGYADIGERLEAAIQAAHTLICERAAQSAETENMGTTVVAVVVRYDDADHYGEAWVAWVGDSRVYLLRRGQLHQVSRDHSRVWPLIESGQISWDELKFHPDRSKITNALIARRSQAEPETKRLDLLPGDQLLLCSDGLSGEVRPEDIEKTMALYPPEQAVAMLIDKANAPKAVFAQGQQQQLEGGNDNITAIIIRIPADQTETQPLAVPPAFKDNAPTLVDVPKAKKSARAGLIVVALLLLLALVGAGLFLVFAGSAVVGLPTEAAVAAPPPADTATAAGNSVIVAVESGGSLPSETPPPEPASPDNAPVEQAAREPTVTRGPVTSPTAPPTPTATPSPLPTATPTTAITATVGVDVYSLPAPTLLEPKADELGRYPVDTTRETKFVWQWPAELTDELSFQIMVWLRDAEPTGAHDARFLKQDSSFKALGDGQYSVLLALDGASGVTATSADYLWAVSVVRVQPQYEWLGIVSEARPISLVVPDASGPRPK